MNPTKIRGELRCSGRLAVPGTSKSRKVPPIVRMMGDLHKGLSSIIVDSRPWIGVLDTTMHDASVGILRIFRIHLSI